MTAPQTILVARATRHQGGAVVRHLRDGGFAVRGRAAPYFSPGRVK